jgi:signal transduction histidine kinase
LPKVYYLSPGMPAKRIEDAGSSASPDALRQRIVGAVADRGWRNILYHRSAGSFDLYLSASRLPTLLALAGLALLTLVTLPVAVFIARGAARRTVGQALQPLQALSHETRTIAPTALSRRVTSPTGVAELTNVAEAINAMLVRIEASHQALTQFTADVSHELRTPLTHLRAQVQWALDERRTREQQVEALGLIGDSVDQTARLIEGLLTLARGDSRELTPRLCDFDLSAMTEEVAEIGTVMCGDKAIAVRAGSGSGSGSGSGVTVYGDPEYTRQILLNFVSNAVRHTQAGSVEVALTCEDGAVRVDVRDTGEGIGPEHVPRVFDRFYRAEASRSRDHGGAGLGLAIARALAVAQRARVSVRSAPGMGSTFTLDLPADRTEWASRERGAMPPGA